MTAVNPVASEFFCREKVHTARWSDAPPFSSRPRGFLPALKTARRSRSGDYRRTLQKCTSLTVERPEIEKETLRGDPHVSSAQLPEGPLNGSDLAAGSSDTATEAASQPPEVISDPIANEISLCEDIQDVLEIVEEEGDCMGGSLIVTALFKCVNLAKRQAGQPGKQARTGLAQLGKGQAFTSLFKWTEAKVPDMQAKDLAVCIWCMATMKFKSVRLLKVLQKELEANASQMDQHDLSMTLWAFGTLKHHPGSLLDTLGEAAIPLLPTFKTKGLSMMMWAFAKLDHSPPPILSGGIVNLFDKHLEEYSPQSIANILYALGKLQRCPRAGLCERVDGVLKKQERKFLDIELANLLYGFVKAGYQSPTLIGIIEKRIAEEKVLQQSLPVVWATLVWGAGALGMQLQPETLSALENEGLEAAASYNALSVCNIAWGLAMLGEVHHPVFPKAVEAVVESHSRRTLEPRLMRQLFQAVTSARVLGVEIQIPEELEANAYKWWRKATLGMPLAVAHDAVAKAVRKLQLDSELHVQHNVGYGLPLVDLAIEKPDGTRIAIQVVSPSEHALNDGNKQLGRVIHAQRLLNASGWKAVALNAAHLPRFNDLPAMIGFMGQYLDQLGVPSDWEAAARAAPMLAPAHIRRRSSQGSSKHDGAPTTKASMPQTRQATPGSRKPGVRDDGEVKQASGRRGELNTPSSLTALRDTPHQARQHPGTGGAWLAEQSRMQVVSREAHAKTPESSARNTKSDAEGSIPERLQDESDDRRTENPIMHSLTGDFMEGWVDLSKWKSRRKVQPGSSRGSGS